MDGVDAAVAHPRVRDADMVQAVWMCEEDIFADAAARALDMNVDIAVGKKSTLSHTQSNHCYVQASQ